MILHAWPHTGISQDAECRSEGFAPTGQFLLDDDNFEYLQPNTTSRVGHLVIVSQMRFTCHGYITGWSALTQFESSERGIDNLNHDITFQLWRPSSTDSSIYTFVGSETIEFVGTSLRDNLILLNGTQYLNFTSAQSSGERLTFQPGDVVGWYIHRTVQSTDIPLRVVYRPSFNAGNPTVRPVDMYVMEIADTRRSNTPPPCELSLSSDKLTIIPSVIPYVTVNYGEYNNYYDHPSIYNYTSIQISLLICYYVN